MNETAITITAIRTAMLQIAASVIGDHDDAEDVVQDAMMSILRRYGRIDAVPLSYVRRAVTNKALNHLRAVRRRKAHLTDWSLLSQPRFVNPSAGIERSSEYEALLDAIDTLPARAREVASLHWVEQRTCPEIAQERNISVKAVEKRVSYARKRIRQILAFPAAGIK